MAKEIDLLKERVKELEELLCQKNENHVSVRHKIGKMSSEVVDSNPYRLGKFLLVRNKSLTYDHKTTDCK